MSRIIRHQPFRPFFSPLSSDLNTPRKAFRRMSLSPGTKIYFGPYEVTSQVFLTTPHSFALVNLKPLLPGHVLVCPLRQTKRLSGLNTAETLDLFNTVQRVQKMLARHYFPHPAPEEEEEEAGGSFNIAIQDGPEAGQTVAHLHVHVIPRVRGVSAKPDDGTAGDELYEKMAGEEGNVGGALWDANNHNQQGEKRPTPGGKFDRIEDSARKARSMQEMEEEAALFARVLEEVEGPPIE